jgi:ABC-type transport system involved in multi-copper enzyme maturation permease subunit
MNKYMNQIITIAKKEFKDAIRNKVFLTFLIFLLGLTAISIYVGSVNYQAKVSLFEKTYAQLIASGQPANTLIKPEFFPLQLLRATIEYLEIIGAVLAISLGYLSIAKEKGNGTLPLIFTRPISRKKYYIGKMFGNIALIVSISVILFLFTFLLIRFVGGVNLNGLEITKILLTTGATILYLFIFFSLSALLTIIVKHPSNALIFSFVFWLFFVLIVPQIGDTMDTDNQVPGGFFNAIHVNKEQSNIILKDFSTYEYLRNGTEEISITKHYERLVFAFLGIKDMYNNKSLGFIFKDKLQDIDLIVIFLLVFGITPIYAFKRSKNLWQQNE